MKLSLVVSTQPASFSAVAYQGASDNTIEKIAGLGYDGVELAVRDPDLLDRSHLVATIRGMGLEVPAIGTGQACGEEGLSFTAPEERVRRQAITRIKRQIDLARLFDAKVILGLIRGRTEPSASRKDAEAWLIEAMRECSAYAEAARIGLALEPINRYETDLINTVEEGLMLIEKVASPNLGLLLDTFHMNIEEHSIEAAIKAAGARITHFHIADSNRWYPGAGHIDFRRVVQVLSRVGYEGFLSAEILPEPDADTCARRTVENMKKTISGLQIGVE